MSHRQNDNSAAEDISFDDNDIRQSIDNHSNNSNNNDDDNNNNSDNIINNGMLH